MSTSGKKAAIDIRSHLILRHNGIQKCIDLAAEECEADPKLGAKLTAVKTAISDVISYIDSRVRNG